MCVARSIIPSLATASAEVACTFTGFYHSMADVACLIVCSLLGCLLMIARGHTVTDSEQEGLRAAIESLHGCKASFQSADLCRVSDNAEHTREVATFALAGHASAPLAYAWTDVRGQQRKHRVVLHSGGVTSAMEALTGFLLFHRETPPDPHEND